MSNVIGFDLDGVVFSPPVPFYELIKDIDLNFLVKKLKKKDVFKKLFYGGIKVNGQIKELLENLRERGYKIVIISGHPEECKTELITCLNKHKIFFHDMHLCPDGDSHKEFKLEKIKETNCSFYIEDRWDIVDFLRGKIGSACYIIHYHERYSIINELKILFNI